MQIGDSPLPFIQDRTIYEDAEIFARTLHEQGSMTEVDYRNYAALFRIRVSVRRKPDLIIYLKAGPESLMRRIASRGRASEQGIHIKSKPGTQVQDPYSNWAKAAA